MLTLPCRLQAKHLLSFVTDNSTRRSHTRQNTMAEKNDIAAHKILLTEMQNSRRHGIFREGKYMDKTKIVVITL